MYTTDSATSTGSIGFIDAKSSLTLEASAFKALEKNSVPTKPGLIACRRILKR